MFRIIIYLAVSTCICLHAAGRRNEVREIKVLGVSRSPKLDGKLDDLAWRGAAMCNSIATGFTNVNGLKLAHSQAIVFLTYDQKCLYLAMIINLPVKTKLEAKSSSKEFSWGDDLLQIFLEPRLNGNYYHFGFNSQGVATDAGIKCATKVEENRWFLEVPIPWKKIKFIPKQGKVLGFNLITHQTPEYKEWTCWAPVFGAAAKPERFGHMILGKFKTIPSIPRSPKEDDF